MAEILPEGRTAARVGVPRDWLRLQATAGTIPSLQVGRQRFYNPAAVLEAMAMLASRLPRGDKAVKAGVRSEPGRQRRKRSRRVVS